MTKLTIHTGDAIEELRKLPAGSVHCCVTSPPYWGLRSYLPAGHPRKALELGSEKTPAEYVAKMVEVFAEVWRVLREDGTLWLNLGDTYAANRSYQVPDNKHVDVGNDKAFSVPEGLKEKDLVGIPWRVALALQSAGWYLRSDIIWHKPNPMPESVTDRPTKAHEYLFLLTKSARYFYDAEAVKEPASENTNPRISLVEIGRIASERRNGSNTVFGKGADAKSHAQDGMVKANGSFQNAVCLPVSTRNKRSVWTVPSAPFSGAHFATFPPELIRPCIRAGTSARGCCAVCGAPWVRMMERGAADLAHQRAMGRKGEKLPGTESPPLPLSSSSSLLPVPCTVLDPFGGSGVTGMVALEEGRHAVLIEMNPDGEEMIRGRCREAMENPGLVLA